VSVTPQLDDLVSDVKTPLRILFAAVCCLLLMVCANVAGLLLTRTSQRRGELAIRAALGATRGQLLRQLMLESLMLSLGAGVLGIGATSVLLRVLPPLLPANLPRVQDVALDGPVLGFAIAIALLTGLVFGVLPSWRASKQDPASAMAEQGRTATAGRRHFRLQDGLVVAQTAMGLVLLVMAGLLIGSFERVMRVDPGFTPQGMLTFQVAVPSKRYDQAQRSRLFRELLQRLKGMQGVQGATAAFPMPLTQGQINITFSIEGRPNPPGGEPSARVSLVEPGFFETLRIPLKRGRVFLEKEFDEKGTPVVMVNEAFAKQFFPGEDAVGKHMRSGIGSGDVPPMREIVGVVGNVKRVSLTEEAAPEYYIPYEQGPVAPPTVGLRVTGDPESYGRRVAAEVAAVDGGLPVYRVQSYSRELTRVTAQQRFQTLLLTGFAGIALLLAGLGLYAALSYMVTQRTQEMGLRLALGAQRVDVLRLMLGRGLRLAAAGLGTGLLAAALATRWLGTLLYGVKPLDAGTFVGMTAVLLAASAVASWIPAWRAASLEPMETLRRQ
jgi:predicted permease